MGTRGKRTAGCVEREALRQAKAQLACDTGRKRASTQAASTGDRLSVRTTKCRADKHLLLPDLVSNDGMEESNGTLHGSPRCCHCSPGGLSAAPFENPKSFPTKTLTNVSNNFLHAWLGFSGSETVLFTRRVCIET